MNTLKSKNGYIYYQIYNIPKWVKKEIEIHFLKGPLWDGGKVDLIGKKYRYILIKKATPPLNHPDDISIKVFKRKRGIKKGKLVI